MIKIRQAGENDLRAIRILLKELQESTKVKKLDVESLWEQLVDEAETV